MKKMDLQGLAWDWRITAPRLIANPLSLEGEGVVIRDGF